VDICILCHIYFFINGAVFGYLYTCALIMVFVSGCYAVKSSDWNFDVGESSFHRSQASSHRHTQQVVYLLQALLGHCQVHTSSGLGMSCTLTCSSLGMSTVA